VPKGNVFNDDDAASQWRVVVCYHHEACNISVLAETTTTTVAGTPSNSQPPSCTLSKSRGLKLTQGKHPALTKERCTTGFKGNIQQPLGNFSLELFVSRQQAADVFKNKR